MESEILQTIVDELRGIRAALDSNPQEEDALINEKAAAKRLDVKPQTMSVWRHKGIGPPYVKIQNAVRYIPKRLDEYIEDQTVEC